MTKIIKETITEIIDKSLDRPLWYSLIIMSISLCSMIITTGFLYFQFSLLLFTIGVSLSVFFYINKDRKNNNDFYQVLENDETPIINENEYEKTLIGFTHNKNKPLNYDKIWNPQNIDDRPNT